MEEPEKLEKLQVNIRISLKELRHLQEAAEKAWPNLRLTSAKVLLSLAQWKADEILKERKRGGGLAPKNETTG